MVVDIHRSNDGRDWISAIPMPCNWLIVWTASSPPSVGNTVIISHETEDLVRTCYLPSVRQYLTAFDGDNTAAQQPTNVMPELPRWLCFTGYGYDGIAVR